MPPRMPFTRSPVVLLANSGTWLNQALDSVLEPLGYRVVSVGRARELVSDAFRRHAPLACVALAVELVPQDANPARLAAPPVAVAYAAHVLQARGRTSDAIGRLGRSEFAILAPSTAPEGAALMARRLTQALETAGPRPAGLPPLLVRAGYEAVADLHATPLAPDRLLEHAGAALVQARAAGNGERIRAYQG